MDSTAIMMDDVGPKTIELSANIQTNTHTNSSSDNLDNSVRMPNTIHSR